MPEYHADLIYDRAKINFITTDNKLTHYLIDKYVADQYKIVRFYRPNDPAEYWKVTVGGNFGDIMELYSELQTNYSREYIKVQIQTY